MASPPKGTPGRQRRLLPWIVAAAAASMVASWILRRPRASPAAGASLLLVTIDTLRADHVGAYGSAPARTPHLDALAARGLLFEEALSAVPLTLPSHATLLSGLDPPHHGLHDNGGAAFPADRETLATLLKARGYATGAFVGAYVLDRRFGLNRGFDLYDDRIERRPDGASVLESERRAEAVVGAAAAWIGERTGPFLAWVHLYDPHAPYDPPSPQREEHPGRPYDGEVAYTDHWVGRLLEAARARAGERLLVAVVGDHGEGLGDHGERTHGLFLYQSTLRVPLILAGPGIPAHERHRGVARTADLLPTLLARLGVAAPAVQGTDLLGRRSPPPAYAETVYPETFGWSPLHAYREGSLKLIDAPRPELFDLATDPGEARDLSAARPADVERLRRALAALRADERAASAAPADPEVAERLRALGYASGPAAPPSGQARKDPKDVLDLWHGFEDAMDAEARGRPAEALAGLRRLVAQDPTNSAFRRNLASALRRQGANAEAVAVLRELVAAVPEDAHAWHELSVALAAVGRIEEAIEVERRALEQGPGLAEAHNHLGILEAQRGRPAEALGAFEAASAVDPNNARASNNRGNALRGLGRREEAAEAYRRAAELAPRDPDPVNGLGVLAVESGDLESAAGLFARALQIEPGYGEAQLNLAFVEARRGEVGKARQRLRLLLQGQAPADVAGRARRLLRDLGP